jgi:hypothetical protein
MKSFLDSETRREEEERERRKREEGVEAIESKMGSLYKVQIWPRETGRDSELDPCLARVRREQKAASNDGQIRRPFHSDVHLLRTVWEAQICPIERRTPNEVLQLESDAA